ncbi:hypothetical protein MRB53_017063 [Persea americana]|uniref:Uncharacterized protein n=1 Tax=Persea americana TaxID=3435 RepID=A0ACC2M440_PERAE|nr:hypothetical protein MRB53_017063 [Persea americana]
MQKNPISHLPPLLAGSIGLSFDNHGRAAGGHGPLGVGVGVKEHELWPGTPPESFWRDWNRVLSLRKDPSPSKGLVASRGAELKTKKVMKKKSAVVVKKFTPQEAISLKKQRQWPAIEVQRSLKCFGAISIMFPCLMVFWCAHQYAGQSSASFWFSLIA